MIFILFSIVKTIYDMYFYKKNEYKTIPDPPKDLQEIQDWIVTITTIIGALRSMYRFVDQKKTRAKLTKINIMIVLGILALVGAVGTFPAYLHRIYEHWVFSFYFLFHITLHFIAIIFIAVALYDYLISKKFLK